MEPLPQETPTRQSPANAGAGHALRPVWNGSLSEFLQNTLRSAGFSLARTADEIASHGAWRQPVLVILEVSLAFVAVTAAVAITYSGEYWRWRPQVLIAALLLVAIKLVGGLLTRAFGCRWRYVGIRDAATIVRSALLAGGGGLVILHWLQLVDTSLRLVAADTTFYILLSCGTRLSARWLHEWARRATAGSGTVFRRAVIVGAGEAGSAVIKSILSSPKMFMEPVAVVDDNPSKHGNRLHGVPIVGPVSNIAGVAKEFRVEEIIVAMPSATGQEMSRVVEACKATKIPFWIAPDPEDVLSRGPGATTLLGALPGDPRGRGEAEPNVGELPAGLPDARIAIRGGQGPRPEAGMAQPSGPGRETRADLSRGTAVSTALLRGQRILISGGTGFVGSALANRLSADNEVVLFDRRLRNSPWAITGHDGHPNVSLVIGDIMDREAAARAVEGVDSIVHLAAVVGVDTVRAHPRETIETNFLGTLNLLKAAQSVPGLRRFVYFSTSEVFGINSFRVEECMSATIGPVQEARWAYSISKLAGEHLVQSYHREVGLPTVTIRPFNVFGPGRTGDHALLRFIFAALRGEDLVVHGTGDQIRSWCYIDDLVDGVIAALVRSEAVGEDFNLGNPRNTLTILDLARRVVSITRSPSRIRFAEHGFTDVDIRVPRRDKASQRLGFEPKVDVDEGIRRTVDWCRQHEPEIGEGKPVQVPSLEVLMHGEVGASP